MEENKQTKQPVPGAGATAGKGTPSGNLKAAHRKTRVQVRDKDGNVTGFTYPQSFKTFVRGPQPTLLMVAREQWKLNKVPAKRVRKPRVAKAPKLGGEIKVKKG